MYENPTTNIREMITSKFGIPNEVDFSDTSKRRKNAARLLEAVDSSLLYLSILDDSDSDNLLTRDVTTESEFYIENGQVLPLNLNRCAVYNNHSPTLFEKEQSKLCIPFFLLNQSYQDGESGVNIALNLLDGDKHPETIGGVIFVSNVEEFQSELERLTPEQRELIESNIVAIPRPRTFRDLTNGILDTISNYLKYAEKHKVKHE